MKRTQQSLLHFYKKSKQSTESVDDTFPSTSNVLQDDDIMATLETEKTAPSPPVVSPVIEPSLKCLDSKFDIGGYVECKKNLSDEEKVSILQNVWTPDLKFNFPYDNSGKYKRKFQIKWLETFKWLAYSKLREGLFCKFCVLFLNLNQAGKGSHEKLGKLVLKPLTKLKDALEDFRNHEKNDYHKNSLLTADNIKAILEKKQDNILVQLNSKRKDEVIKNRAKLKPIIQTIRLCGRQQIALRGHEDSGRISLEEPKNNDGNFRCLLRYRSKNGDNVLKEHLKTSGCKSMYTSPLIQNEIINLFGDLIQSKILERVSKTNFYTILADETTDISQIEQFSLCIRYVDEQVFSIREDFLTFVPVYDISGEGLANTIKETLKKIGFDLNKIRGQGYDGAAAMRGRFRGVQAIIKDMYPKALYTHCVSHSLNLCLSDATKSQDIRNAFGIISECCSFFNSSAKRTTVLKNKIKEIKPNSQSTKLKSLCETRWVLRHEAVMLFKEFVEPVVAALEEVQNECSGTDSSKRANSLLHCICNFNFLISICVSSKLLSYTYNLSKYLQSKNIDLFNALNQVSDVISVFHSIRENVDLKFNNIYKEAKDVAEKLNIEPKMPRICSSQRNRSNVPSNNIEEYYKKSIFIPYLDDLMMALNERFIPHNETITSLQYVLPSIVVEKPFSYLKKAVGFYENDLPGLNDVIEAEYEIWQAKWKNIEDNLRPTTAIQALSVCDNLMYPNMYELLKILAIIPVSTATAERSFSTLRRLKTYLRNTTSESRLVGLALLAIHRDIDIPDDILLDKFANSGKERNLNLI
jgi:Domain of unknown function (DUF4371)/hAT family C-terminal dimerisation region